MIPQEKYDHWLAHRIAALAHYGQKDKAGVDYLLHPESVVSILVASKPEHWTTDDLHLAMCVGYLHDVVEDTVMNFDDLFRFGMPIEVVERVRLLTRVRTSASAYYAKIRLDDVARRVKLADVHHNSMPQRLALLPVDVQSRLIIKYDAAKDALRSPEVVRLG